MKNLRILTIISVLVFLGVVLAIQEGCTPFISPVPPVPIPTPTPVCGGYSHLIFTTSVWGHIEYNQLPYSRWGTSGATGNYYVIQIPSDWTNYWSLLGNGLGIPPALPAVPVTLGTSMILAYTQSFQSGCNPATVTITNVCQSATQIAVDVTIAYKYPLSPICAAPDMVVDGPGDAVVIPTSALPVVWNTTVIN